MLLKKYLRNSFMESNLKKLILGSYSFPEVAKLEQVSLGGLMNENYTFITGGKKYFVKLYKYYPEAKVEISHAIIDHLISHAIKTYRLVKNNSGKTFSNKNGVLFEISEFIDDSTNRIEEAVSTKIVGQMAQGLAKYHTAIADCNVKFNFVDVFSPEQVKISFQKIENILVSKTTLDDFDEVCLEMVRTKLSYIEKIPDLTKNIPFGNFPVLINHGDFLTGNCLFDSNDNLQHVIDFEHTVKPYRLWDIIKTSAFLARKNKHEIFHSEIDLDVLINFIKNYHAYNFLTWEEVKALPELYMVASVLSDFVLYGYYLADNEKAKAVASRNKKEWFWWFDNKDVVREALTRSLTHINRNGKN